MNRRKFINKTAKIAAGMTIPYLLPSGRLFAATGSQRVKHVVYCLFAGGIRNWESVEYREGNLMPNTLMNPSPISPDIAEGVAPVPRILDVALQNYGTLMKDFRYRSEVTLHYNAHATAISGKYYKTIEMMKPIEHPSIFEYYRKHTDAGQEALNAWWVSDQGGPFPYLQYSKSDRYGAAYAANMIQPSTLFQYPFSAPFAEEKSSQLDELIAALDRHAAPKASTSSNMALNTPQDQVRLRKFLLELHKEHFSDRRALWDDLPGELVNDDMINMFTACEILKAFHPGLMVVNMQDSDIGHSNYTDYCNNLHRADYALAKLWRTIQDDPELRDNTVLIASPEFGRNEESNSIVDAYGRYAVDHTGDELSQRMFCLIAGPPDIVRQGAIIEETYGESIDIVPTIAHLLGFHKDIPDYSLDGKILFDALV